MAKLVLCPLKIELDELLKELKLLGVELSQVPLAGPLSQRSVFKGVLGENGVLVYFSFTGLGKVESAIWTQSLINQLSPIDHVYSCGTCGALSTQLKVLDLIAISEIVEHDFKQLFDRKPNPKFKCAPLRLPEEKSINLQVQIGVLASGDEDVTSFERKNKINQDFGALCVAWESAGFARACRHFKIPHSEIRCVTDLSDSDELEKFKMHLPKAMQKIAPLLMYQF